MSKKSQDTQNDQKTLLTQGKTKCIWAAAERPGYVVVQNKDDITKNDDPSQTKQMAGKAGLATTTTCAVFDLLKAAEIPVAFERQLGPTTFLAPEVTMIPLEIIWRRYAMGSFLERYPYWRNTSKDQVPHRFHRAKFEVFLKTTGGQMRNQHGEPCGETPVDDPLIVDPYAEMWQLCHPHVPAWEARANLNVEIPRADILPPGVTMEQVENLLRRTALVLEGAWSQLGCRLIDLKIEMGINQGGQLVVADVIDADSWRLRDADWKELSKQLFRDNSDLEIVADKYALVARMVERFRIPRQAIVVWRGSESDPTPAVPQVPGVERVDMVLSGHQAPEQCLRALEALLAQFPGGGVILACVGLSNGLGPVLSARTSWPVVAVPVIEGCSPDVWSSLRMPRGVPLVTCLSPKNAVFLALNVLALSNPAAYAARQLLIEQLDD